MAQRQRHGTRKPSPQRHNFFYLYPRYFFWGAKPKPWLRVKHPDFIFWVQYPNLFLGCKTQTLFPGCKTQCFDFRVYNPMMDWTSKKFWFKECCPKIWFVGFIPNHRGLQERSLVEDATCIWLLLSLQGVGVLSLIFLLLSLQGVGVLSLIFPPVSRLSFSAFVAFRVFPPSL